MGNIQTEVFPLKVNSLRRNEFKAVKVISRHQPRMPQWIKLCNNFLIRISFPYPPFFIQEEWKRQGVFGILVVWHLMKREIGEGEKESGGMDRIPEAAGGIIGVYYTLSGRI